MFPSFIGILDIQSWWEVPSIAHFCSLFRAAFNLLDFDIEELEEALLTDGTEECASSLLTDLIVRLLCGCLGNNDISAFNYQMFLRRLFRQKCQETGRYNPFNTDIDFQFLPLRTKVEILYALCDFRLDADDVFELFKNLEAESLRVEPLGWDDNSSAYWYFYGTRLYREDYQTDVDGEKKKRRRRRGGEGERIWQVVCFTEPDWLHLTDKFKSATSSAEKDLHLALSENFLPEIPRLFQEKERLQRKRLLESVPRRTSSRVQTKNKQKEEEEQQKQVDEAVREREIEELRERQLKGEIDINTGRENRAQRRDKTRMRSISPQSSPGREDKTYSETRRTGPRRTNNSLASAVLIPNLGDQPTTGDSTIRKLKSSQILALMEEDLQTDMYKVLEQIKCHEDAWPFMDPVEEDFAPNYYSVIRRPMDLQRMEDRLDQGYYKHFSMFKGDFNLIVNNCRLYNGQDNEYTEMVGHLETAFNKLTQRYFDRVTSSDDDIAVEYPVHNPSPRKAAVKTDRRPRNPPTDNRKRKRNPSQGEESDESDSEKNPKTAVEKPSPESKSTEKNFLDRKKNKKRDKGTDSALKKSPTRVKKKNRSGNSKSEDRLSLKKKKKLKYLKKSRKSRIEKHAADKNRHKKKHSKHLDEKEKKKKNGWRPSSTESHESTKKLKDSELSATSSKEQAKAPDIDFYKDKYDKIKERRRGMLKTDWDLIPEKSKSNFPAPEKDKNIKLKETIEKLKAKSEKNNENISIFDDMFRSGSHKKKKRLNEELDSMTKKADVKSVVTDEYEFVDELSEMNPEHTILASQNKVNTTQRKVSKKHLITKNESATEALEQAVKDINDWLVDTPKLSEFESNSNSPLQDVGPDDYLLIPAKHDEDNLGVVDKDKSANVRKDMNVKKRLPNKDVVKVPLRRKEVQRTIDRLQPGKGKGNLIANIQSTSKQEDSALPLSAVNKSKEVKNSLIVKTEEGSPKLSLGTVLATVGFGLGKQHNFTNETNVPVAAKEKEVVVAESSKNDSTEPEPVIVKDTDELQEVEKNVEEDTVKADDVVSNVMTLKQCQEKATPNLSAWFKAFGAPKTGSGKKKPDESDQDDSKSNDVVQLEGKSISPTNNAKSESSANEEIHSVIPEGGESPHPSVVMGSRPRRTSTGSSISERSSFSQDLDSPRHPSHSSPLLRSPASPRMEDHQKAYPPLNGTVRVGFYQDTASVKSSPEKSCSPRDAPQSPYAAYSQHVYAAASTAQNLTNQAIIQGYGSDRPKSPLPYYDSHKPGQDKKIQRGSEDYPAFGTESVYQQPSSFAEPFSPVRSPYSHHSQHSPYSQVQHSPQTFIQPTTASNVPPVQDSRAFEKTSFPVKKRMYSETCQTSLPETSIVSTPSLVRKSTILSEPQPYLGNKQNITTVLDPEQSTYQSQKTDSNVSDLSSRSNPPSVITSTIVEAAQKTSLHYAQSPKPPVIESDSGQSAVSTADSKIQSVSSKSQYSDNINSIEYSARKSQYKFSGIGMDAPYIKSNSSVPGQNMNEHLLNANITCDLKNIVSNTDFAHQNKAVDMVNMGYSTKIMETKGNQQRSASDILNLDNMVNMGYLMSDCVNSENKLTHLGASKIESLNSDLSTSHKGFEMYMASTIAGRSDPGRHQPVQSKSTDSIKPSGLFSDINMTRGEMALKQTFSGCPFPSDESAKNYLPNYIEWHMEMEKNAEMQNKIDSSKSYASNSDILSATAGMGKSKGESTLSMYNPNTNETNESIQRQQPELRIPIIRPPMSSMIKADSQKSDIFDPCNVISGMHTSKSSDNIGSSAPMLNANLQSFKSQSHAHSTLCNEPTIRTMPNHSQLMERCAKDERALSGFQPSGSGVYHNKTIPLTHLYPKNVHTSTHNPSSSNPIFPTTSMTMAFSRENTYPAGLQHVSTIQSQPAPVEKTTRSRKKKSAVEITPVSVGSNQSFHSYQRHKVIQPPISEQSVISLKTANVPGSAFNFGPPAPVGVTLNSGVYSDPNFLEELRNSNQYMAANYIVAAAAAHQRNTPERNEKCVKPVHQSVPHNSSNPYQFPTHTQGYPFMSLDHSSPLYQQYIIRHQDDLLHSGPRNMGIFPPGYHSSLGVRQSFDSITRPSWL